MPMLVDSDLIHFKQHLFILIAFIYQFLMPFKDAWLTSSNEYLLFTAVVIAVLMNIYILIAVFIAVL